MTLLDGVWLWLCLIGLPVGLAISVLLLGLIDQRWIRRSIQLALVLSLAAHVAFIVYAYRTEVFDSTSIQTQEKQSTQKKKKIKVRPRKIETFHWQEINEVETREPELKEVEPEREQVEVAPERPQPTPVEKPVERVQPNVYERKQSQRSTPRQGVSLSKLSRSENSAASQSSTLAEQVARQPSSAGPPATLKAQETQATKSNSSQATPRRAERNELAKTAPAEPPFDSPTQNSSVKSARRQQVNQNQPRQELPDVSQQRQLAKSDPNARSPVQRQLPPTATPQRLATTTQEPQPHLTPEPTLSPAIAVQAERQRPTPTRQERAVRSTPDVVPGIVQQTPRVSARTEQQSQPSVEQNPNTTAAPRRAFLVTQTPVSPSPAERPSKPMIAKNQPSRLSGPGTLSVDKSTAGIAGVGKSMNLDKTQVTGERPSWQASNSADRRQSTRNAQPDLAMSPSQKSAIARSVASPNRTPGSTRRATVDSRAKFAAMKEKSEFDASSSATLVDASSDVRRGEVSASKGSAQIDVGPEKLVSGQQTGRASGGGQPQPNFVMGSASGRSNERSNVEPTLAANTKAETIGAPLDPGSSEPSYATSDPDSLSVTRSDSGGPSAAGMVPNLVSVIERDGPDGADVTGELSRRTQQGDPGTPSNAIVNGVAASGRRSSMTTPGAPASANIEIELSSSPTNSNDSNDNGDPAERLAQELGQGEAVEQSLTSLDPAKRNETVERTRSNGDTSLPGASEDQADLEVANNGSGRRRQRSAIDTQGPAVDIDNELASNSPRRGPSLGALPRSSGPIELPPSNETTNVAFDPSMTAEVGLRGPGDVGPTERKSGGGLTVDLDVPAGPSGLGEIVETQVGINDRRAREDEGPLQAFADSRFTRSNPGGAPTFNTAAVMSADAFRARSPLPLKQGGSPQTEQAIELGLEFLQRYQMADGRWTLTQFGTGNGDAQDERAAFSSDAAATGLAVIAFQGAGYNHREYKYAETIHRGINWLVEHQDDDGGLFVEADDESNKYCRLYTHGIAALALCEAYGMTQDPDLRVPAQQAIRYIEATQDKKRGGWRYTPGYTSDTSVTGWMMMALKSGELAGLHVSEGTYDGIRRWLDVSVVKGSPHLFRYNPYASAAPTQVHGRSESRSMTAVGLLLRLYFGANRDDGTFQKGADYLLGQMPSDNSQVLRDTYYWYYATQILRHMGGEHWDRWSRRLHTLLRSSQVKNGEFAGSWDPLRPVPDRWGGQAGRIYLTTMNLLSLEVDYRLLPLYDETVK